MELLEYQAKELFKMVEIPILPSQTIKDSRQLKQLQIPYPVVLKSQVRSGGRGKAGGVRFAANTIDAIAAARTIFKLSILGEYPEVILAEAHYNAEREFFLAIVLDYDIQRPVLLGSVLGGMNVDSLLANLQQVIIEEEFSLFYARRLAAKMGLSGKLICSVSEIIAKMYRLFESRDLDFVEINPLGVNTRGELMALDGKITINDRGFARQQVIKALSFSEHQKKAYHHNFLVLDRNSPLVEWSWLDWQNKTGKIATICNSFDLSLLTWDLLNEKKIDPGYGILIENKGEGELSDLEIYQRTIQEIIDNLGSIEEIKAIIFNIRETEAINATIIQTICDYCHSQTKLNHSANSDRISQNHSSQTKSNKSVSSSTAEDKEESSQTQFILRLIGENKVDLPMPERVHVTNDLDTAIKKAITVVKSN